MPFWFFEFYFLKIYLPAVENGVEYAPRL